MHDFLSYDHAFADFLELQRVVSLAWVNQMRGLLPDDPLFGPLLKDGHIPPAQSAGLMQVLRDIPFQQCPIPGTFILERAVRGLASHINAEAQDMGPALSQGMCDSYYQRFNLKVERALYLAELHHPVLGFPMQGPPDAFAALKAECLKLCPTCAENTHHAHVHTQASGTLHIPRVHGLECSIFAQVVAGTQRKTAE